eukprot:COSAG06_NODE_5290_length_3582_cov_57.421476_5_plen_99_part_00
MSRVDIHSSLRPKRNGSAGAGVASAEATADDAVSQSSVEAAGDSTDEDEPLFLDRPSAVKRYVRLSMHRCTRVDIHRTLSKLHGRGLSSCTATLSDSH